MILLKNIHLISVGISFIYFLIRGYWMLVESRWLQQKIWGRVIPDAVDTALLTSGVFLVMLTEQYPTEQDWLAAKLIALLVYVVLGSIAIKRGKTLRIRLICFALACLMYIYILGVAMQRDAFSWLVML